MLHGLTEDEERALETRQADGCDKCGLTGDDYKVELLDSYFEFDEDAGQKVAVYRWGAYCGRCDGDDA